MSDIGVLRGRVTEGIIEGVIEGVMEGVGTIGTIGATGVGAYIGVELERD